MKLKQIGLLILSLFTTLFLSGCMPCSWGFNYCDACWQFSCNSRQCGPCITHHCEQICGPCDAKGQACKECWECLRKDACMVN